MGLKLSHVPQAMGIPKSVVESFPTIGTADVNLIDKVIHFNPGYLGHTKLRFKSNSKRKLYISLYRNDYGFAVSIGLDCKVMKSYGMVWNGDTWNIGMMVYTMELHHSL